MAFVALLTIFEQDLFYSPPSYFPSSSQEVYSKETSPHPNHSFIDMEISNDDNCLKIFIHNERLNYKDTIHIKLSGKEIYNLEAKIKKALKPSK
jgi:hypothetical protein